ncbi:MAG TPA: M23 family metallopeptidase [Acidimicrobiales bacterium]
MSTSRGVRARGTAAALLAFALFAGLATTPAAGADDPPTTPPNFTTTTTTPGGSTTTTTSPKSGTSTTTSTTPATTTTLPPPDSPALQDEGEDSTGPVPGAGVTIPARAAGVPAAALPDVAGIEAATAAQFAKELAGLTATRDAAAAEHDKAVIALAAAVARVHVLDARYRSLSGTQRAAIRKVATTRKLMAQRAAEAYMRGVPDDTELALSSSSVNELAVRRGMLSSILEADVTSAKDYRAAVKELGSRLRHLTADRTTVRKKQRSAEKQVKGTEVLLFGAQARLSAVQVSADGGQFVFPVAEPYNFIDSFGDPRLSGTSQSHAHLGCDILAAQGTPLFAVERGVVTQLDGDTGLGGIAVWLKGQSGASYYYAHMMAIAPGIVVGSVVDPGTILGFVGSTGDASPSAPHVHFEIHPDGGVAVDPYPFLKTLDEIAHNQPVEPITPRTLPAGANPGYSPG